MARGDDESGWPRWAVVGRAAVVGCSVMRFLILSVVLVAGLAAPLHARDMAGAAIGTDGRGESVIDELSPVAVPAPSALALRYSETGNWLWVADEIWAIAVFSLLLFSGISARMRTLAQRLGRWWFLTIAAYVVLYTLLLFVIDLPIHYLQGFVRQHAYGMSNQTLERWFGNSLKRLGVAIVSGVLFAWVPFFLIARSPKRWWLYTTLLTVPFAFFAMLVTPVWIDPLFNHYEPLKDKALEQQIVAQARRAGIEGGRIYQVDKSVDTKALNAFVKGVFDTKRIVLYDTLLNRLNERETLVVLGHEMGHYVLGHVPRTILLSSVVVLAGLFWVDRAGRWLLARFHGRFGFDRLSDVAAVPLIILLLQVSALVLEPVAYAYSRQQEHEADRFALELTRTNRSAALAFVKLQHDNLSNPRPNPVFKILRATHPSIGERIEFCNTYHPWTKGEPLVYGGLFRR